MIYELLLSGTFKADVKRLKRKHPHLVDDPGPLLETIEANGAQGDAIPGLEGLVYKARLGSSDMRRGRSGGFRLIQYRPRDAHIIYLLTIYPKTDQENIQAAEIRALIDSLPGEPPETPSRQDGGDCG